MTELEVFQKSLEVSRATLVVSIVLSLVSMVFAILGMAFQRSHNKRSLRPLCDLRLESSGEVLRLCLRNGGLGPMILGRICLRTEGRKERKEEAPGTELEDLEADLKGALPLGLRKGFTALPRPGLILGPGQAFSLVEVPLDQASAVTRFRKALEGLPVEVGFQDIYDKEYQAVQIL